MAKASSVDLVEKTGIVPSTLTVPFTMPSSSSHVVVPEKSPPDWVVIDSAPRQLIEKPSPVSLMVPVVVP